MHVVMGLYLILVGVCYMGLFQMAHHEYEGILDLGSVVRAWITEVLPRCPLLDAHLTSYAWYQPPGLSQCRPLTQDTLSSHHFGTVMPRGSGSRRRAQKKT